jgi:hypothetical protein
MTIDHPEFAHMVADAFYLVQKPQSPGKLVRQAPEVITYPPSHGVGALDKRRLSSLP